MRVKVQKVTYTIPEIKCTYYNPRTRRFVMVFMDGTEKSSYVHPEDELNIVTGFALCLAKAVMGNKQNLRETAAKVYRDPARKHKKVIVPIEDAKVKTEEAVVEETAVELETPVAEPQVEPTVEEPVVEPVVEEIQEEVVDKNQMSIDDFKEELDNGFQDTVAETVQEFVPEEVVEEQIEEVLEEPLEEALEEEVKEEPSPSAEIIQDNIEKMIAEEESILNEEVEEIAEPLSEEVEVSEVSIDEVIEEEGKLYLYRVAFKRDGNESFIDYNTLEEANNYANWLKSNFGVDSTVVQIELTE